jgi:hypothetical protein|tara:strand:+ start:1767 stop:2156 length:390 start_codon:yes stop_codon:yes gene_type:complete
MKHLFKTLTLTIGAILLSGGMLIQPLVAQETPPPQQEPNQGVMKLPILVDCGPAPVVEKLLRDHGEIPTAQALVTWSLPNGQFLRGPMVIWANPITFSVSIVIMPAVDFACIVMPGANFGPVINEGKST